MTFQPDPGPRPKASMSPRQREHYEMTKDIGLMNQLERYAEKCEEDARRARAAIKMLEVRA